MKNCAKCGETKVATDFHKNVRSSDGLTVRCKQCATAAAANWYYANTEKSKEAMAAWRIANHGKNRALQNRWAAENRDKTRESSRKWKAAHLERSREQSTKWQAANPESGRIYQHNRRARERETGGKLSKGLATRLFKLQRGLCPCCKQSLGDDYHMDHIMPLALGGTNTDNNIQLLRTICNLQKNARHPVEFMQQRGFLL